MVEVESKAWVCKVVAHSSAADFSFMYLSRRVGPTYSRPSLAPTRGAGWLPVECCDPPSASDLELDLYTNKNMDKNGTFVGKAGAVKTKKGKR